MPVQKSKSNLMAKLGDRLRKAHEEHKNDETEFSNFGDLPAGINGGIARLVDCKFVQIKADAKKNAGEWMFYAAGTVVSPKEFEGQRIEGLRTQISEVLCDTPDASRKTVDDHLKWIYNELRKLGVNTAEMEFEDLEPTVAVLLEAHPYFKFRTWKGEMQKTGPYAGREPRVNHQWLGFTEYTPDEDPGAGTEDETATTEDSEPSTNGDGAVEEAPPPKGRKLTAGPAKMPPSGVNSDRVVEVGGKRVAGPKAAPAFDDQGDIDTLVKRAKKGDEAARQELAELAVANGADPDEVENAGSWDEVAEMTKGKVAATEEEEVAEQEPEAEEEDRPPQKGELWFYKPLDPKTQRPQKKALECEITNIYPPSKNFPKGACDLRSIDTRAVYRGAPLDKLMKTAEG
jgi:hypothetical protein